MQHCHHRSRSPRRFSVVSTIEPSQQFQSSDTPSESEPNTVHSSQVRRSSVVLLHQIPSAANILAQQLASTRSAPAVQKRFSVVSLSQTPRSSEPSFRERLQSISITVPESNESTHEPPAASAPAANARDVKIESHVSQEGQELSDILSSVQRVRRSLHQVIVPLRLHYGSVAHARKIRAPSIVNECVLCDECL